MIDARHFPWLGVPHPWLFFSQLRQWGLINEIAYFHSYCGVACCGCDAFGTGGGGGRSNSTGCGSGATGCALRGHTRAARSAASPSQVSCPILRTVSDLLALAPHPLAGHSLAALLSPSLSSVRSLPLTVRFADCGSEQIADADERAGRAARFSTGVPRLVRSLARHQSVMFRFGLRRMRLSLRQISHARVLEILTWSRYSCETCDFCTT